MADEKDTGVNFEISCGPWVPVEENMDVFTGELVEEGYSENTHTNDEVARKAGFTGRIVEGRMIVSALLSRMLGTFLGSGWMMGGELAVKFVDISYPGDVITAKGIIRKSLNEGKAARIELEVWCENQKGEKIVVGTARGYREHVEHQGPRMRRAVRR